MNITCEGQDTSALRWTGWHILTVAEAGFSRLDIYGRHQHGLNIEVIRQFADKVNDRDELESLHPQAPLSAVPRRYFREQKVTSDLSVLNDFKRHIIKFLDINRNIIHATHILVDFHVSSALVPCHFINETEEVFHLSGKDSSIQQVVIFA